MKKLLAVFLILTMCLCVLTACFDESADTGADNGADNGTNDNGTNDNGTNDNGTNDSGTNDNGTNDSDSSNNNKNESGNGTSTENGGNTEQLNPSDLPIELPENAPTLEKGERITEEIFEKVTSEKYTNFTYEERGVLNDQTFVLICAVDGFQMISTRFENGVFSSRYGNFKMDGTVYEMTYDTNTEKWNVHYAINSETNYFPIDEMPCGFSDFTFDEQTGNYVADIDMGEGDVKATIVLRFKGEKLIYACAQAEEDGNTMTDEYFIYNYGSTTVGSLNKEDVVFNNASTGGESTNDNVIIKPVNPNENGNTATDKEENKEENKDESKDEYYDPEHEYDKDGNGVPDADFNGDGRIDKNDFPEGYYPGSSENNQGSSGSTDDEKIETNDKVETGDPLEGERFEEELRREAERYLNSIPKFPKGLEISEEDWNSMKSNPPTNYTYSRQMTMNGKDCIEITMLDGREFMRVEIVDGTIIRKWCGRMENGRMVGYEYNFSKRMWERVNSSLSSDYPIATAPFELSDFTFDRKSGAYSITMTEGNMSATISLYFEHGTLSRLDQTNGSDSMISYFYDYGKTEIKFPKDEEIDESSSSNGPSYGYTDQVGPDYNGGGAVSGGTITNNPNGSYNASLNGEVNGEGYFVQTVLPENNASSTEEFYTFSDVTGNTNATASYYSFNTK